MTWEGHVISAVSKKPDPGPRTSLRLTNLTGPRTSFRLANWSVDQFAFDQLVRGPTLALIDILQHFLAPISK